MSQKNISSKSHFNLSCKTSMIMMRNECSSCTFDFWFVIIITIIHISQPLSYIDSTIAKKFLLQKIIYFSSCEAMRGKNQCHSVTWYIFACENLRMNPKCENYTAECGLLASAMIFNYSLHENMLALFEIKMKVNKWV